MWRTFASLSITFLALAAALVSIPVCFFLTAGFWRDLLGRFGAFYGALAAFLLCMFGIKLLLRLADYIMEPYSGPFDESVYAAAPRETLYQDWQRYAADIVRNRRYAFYARTRQWEKLAALQEQMRQVASADVAPVVAQSSAPAPRRTSMGHFVSADERRRAARRTTHAPARSDRWHALE